MTEMEYENYCEMLSVMDKPIKMKTVTLNNDIVDGRQRQHVDWNNLNIRRNKLIEDIKNGEEIPHIVICKQILSSMVVLERSFDMTYGEIKETEAYINAEDIEVCVNGEEPINEEYFYVDEFCMLDDLPVIGTGNMADGTLHIDLVCTNWDKRFEPDWIPESR